MVVKLHLYRLQTFEHIEMITPNFNQEGQQDTVPLETVLAI
ncbi:MAG TPA: hypothetical protein VK203_17025 [Nostocaceae cyanobacterium]|nr:hypothetical protein [Nostocaceae cyanobacterium]